MRQLQIESIKDESFDWSREIETAVSGPLGCAKESVQVEEIEDWFDRPNDPAQDKVSPVFEDEYADLREEAAGIVDLPEPQRPRSGAARGRERRCCARA